MRAKETPRVLSPGNLSTLTKVTFEPFGFSVFPGMLSPWNKKSLATAYFGSLQNLPFRNTIKKMFKILFWSSILIFIEIN